MAHVQRRTRQSGGRRLTTYRARYRDPEGREHSQTFTKRADAQRWLDTMTGDLARGDWIDPRRARETFEHYAEGWRDAQVHRPSTAARVEMLLRRHAYPYLGERAIGSIRTSDIQGWIRGRADELAPATVTLLFRWVSTIFRAAVTDDVIRKSPCVGIKLPKIERDRVVPLMIEHVACLIDAVPDRYRALVMLAAGTGLRQGEALGLTLDKVDFLRRTLVVEQQLLSVAGRDPELGPPKTASSRRTIPLPAVVIDALAAHLAKYPAEPGGFIFTTEQGAPIDARRFGRSVWVPALTASALPEGTTFHSLRHYYASLLIHHGESVKVVQERLGHASATETLSTYSHLWGDHEERTRGAVDGVLGALRGPYAAQGPS